MQFEMITDLEKSLPAVIDFNFEAMKEYLTTNLEKYNNLVVTETGIKEAKADKATLNKLYEAIENKRKEVKKQCLKPYEEFEKKVKEITSMIGEPIKAIDNQIKAFDEIKKSEKKAEIELFYTSIIGEFDVMFPLNKLWNDRWMNATYKIDDIKKEISDTVEKGRNDIKILQAMKLESEVQIIDAYLKNFNMSEALSEKTRLEKLKQDIIESSKIQIEEAIQEVKEITPTKEEVTYNEPKSEAEELKTIKVIFYDTTEAFRIEMKALTQKHNITYGGIK